MSHNYSAAIKIRTKGFSKDDTVTYIFYYQVRQRSEQITFSAILAETGEVIDTWTLP